MTTSPWQTFTNLLSGGETPENRYYKQIRELQNGYVGANPEFLKMGLSFGDIPVNSSLLQNEAAEAAKKILPGMNATTGLPPTFMDKMLGYEGANGAVGGWGGMALGAASGIGQSLMSMKQYGLMEDQLKENKRQFDINYAMQRKSFNNQLEDRQRARVAANAGAYESVSDYMKKYGA